MIFHCPFTLNPEAKSASGIRPLKMLEAFRGLGYSIDVVSGNSSDRKKDIKKIIKNIKNGKKYDFVYSESSTMPTALADRHHLPLRPLLDFNFFYFLKDKNIKIGLFYRDIYWMFEGYGKNLPWYKKQLALLFYRFDLMMYSKLLDKLYLPSLNMEGYINIVNKNIIDTLPPAHSTADYRNSPDYNNKLNLLYIGGMGVDYKMHKLFDALKVLPNVSLTLCTRENEWLAVKDEYGLLPDNINVVHKSGNDLEALYDDSHLAVLFVEPHEYREFAVPFKLYEYIGRNKPIICTSSTLVGNFVEDKDIGWALEYSTGQLINLLANITKEDIGKKTQQVLYVKKNETWESRARKVCADLDIKL